MKRLLIIVCVLACTFFAKAKDRTQYVNPLMGSQSTSNYQQVILIRPLPVPGG